MSKPNHVSQHPTHSQFPVFPSALHLTDASLLRHHTFAAPCSPLPSSTSACPQLSVPMSHYRISSHTAYRFRKNFPFNFKEVPFTVMKGASSLNFPHAHLTRHRTA